MHLPQASRKGAVTNPKIRISALTNSFSVKMNSNLLPAKQNKCVNEFIFCENEF